MQGAKHLLDAEPDAVRADYVLTEVGGIVSQGSHGTNVEVVTGEKGGAVVDIVVTGTPSHGSTPFGADNAIVKAAEVVRRLAEHRPETRDQRLVARLGRGPALRCGAEGRAH